MRHTLCWPPSLPSPSVLSGKSSNTRHSSEDSNPQSGALRRGSVWSPCALDGADPSSPDVSPPCISASLVCTIRSLTAPHEAPALESVTITWSCPPRRNSGGWGDPSAMQWGEAEPENAGREETKESPCPPPPHVWGNRGTRQGLTERVPSPVACPCRPPTPASRHPKAQRTLRKQSIYAL